QPAARPRPPRRRGGRGEAPPPAPTTRRARAVRGGAQLLAHQRLELRLQLGEDRQLPVLPLALALRGHRPSPSSRSSSPFTSPRRVCIARVTLVRVPEALIPSRAAISS